MGENGAPSADEQREQRGRREMLDQQARAHEEQTAEGLAVVREAREQWDSYGVVMRDHGRRLEETSAGDDTKNYFVQRRVGARRELESFVGQLVLEQAETLDEAARETKSQAAEQSDRLQREKAGAAWD